MAKIGSHLTHIVSSMLDDPASDLAATPPNLFWAGVRIFIRFIIYTQYFFKWWEICKIQSTWLCSGSAGVFLCDERELGAGHTVIICRELLHTKQNADALIFCLVGGGSPRRVCAKCDQSSRHLCGC